MSKNWLENSKSIGHFQSCVREGMSMEEILLDWAETEKSMEEAFGMKREEKPINPLEKPLIDISTEISFRSKKTRMKILSDLGDGLFRIESCHGLPNSHDLQTVVCTLDHLRELQQAIEVLLKDAETNSELPF